MGNEKFGIENIKEVAKIAFTVYNDLTGIFKDGKVDFGEKLKLLSVVLNGVPLVTAIPLLKNEIIDLSSAEKKELSLFMTNEFTLTNITGKALDSLITKTVNWALDTFSIIEAWKAAKSEK